MVWGCISAHSMCDLHVCGGTINAELYIQVLEQHMLPSRPHIFQGRTCLFPQDNAKPPSAQITTAWLHSKRVRVLNCPDLSPIENILRIMKQKIRQRAKEISVSTFDILSLYYSKFYIGIHFSHCIAFCFICILRSIPTIF
uniref:DDE-1 domain-containing protein n=1 Tax=Esox lucius TaxID=8010 RepID=A0AAY5KU80_ESOLU